jgi:hypothetical protein
VIRTVLTDLIVLSIDNLNPLQLSSPLKTEPPHKNLPNQPTQLATIEIKQTKTPPKRWRFPFGAGNPAIR